MAEIKQAELKTLAFMRGPWKLLRLSSEMRKSDYQGREDYEVGLVLEVESPLAATYSVRLPKRDLLYHRLSAYLNEHPEAKVLNISWDERTEKVIISGALPTA